MALNLHATVRGVINSVSPDIAAVWRVSTGSTTDDTGRQNPTYAAGVAIRAQVQPVDRSTLKLLDQLNMQGVFRAAYAYGNIQGIVRVGQLGGDLLQFPLIPGGPVRVWKVTDIPETWGVGWCKVIVCLQNDAPV